MEVVELSCLFGVRMDDGWIKRHPAIENVYGSRAEIGGCCLAATEDRDCAVLGELDPEQQCDRLPIRSIGKYSVFPFPLLSLERQLLNDTWNKEIVLFSIGFRNKFKPSKLIHPTGERNRSKCWSKPRARNNFGTRSIKPFSQGCRVSDNSGNQNLLHIRRQH